MRTVAFITPTLTLGGAERSLAKAANLLFEAGWDVHVIALLESQTRINDELSPAISVWEMNGKRSWHPTLWWKVRRTLRRIQPSVVAGWSTHANLVAVVTTAPWDRWQLVISERNYLPEIANARGTSRIRRGILLRLVKLLYPTADVITANSKRSIRFLERWIRSGTAFKFLPNMVDVASIEKLGYDPEVPFPKFDGLRILAVGRLTYQKGFDILLAALALLPDNISWRLALIGDGPEQDVLRRLAEQLKVNDRIDWLGATFNPYQAFERADLVVVPSRFEGFPNTAMEAMAAGKALICADCRTGPRELTERGVFGTLVPVEQPAALAVAIADLANDPERRSELGRRAREHVQATYSPDAVRHIYLNVFAPQP
jgi:GalNAc-alpha-(1->4)-GalNAc-alpha-(1->3)-diNAcBac-PP-undecaprenol alpha-1,4-N-acetyl-D-galactosaminyltransferase